MLRNKSKMKRLKDKEKKKKHRGRQKSRKEPSFLPREPKKSKTNERLKPGSSEKRRSGRL